MKKLKVSATRSSIDKNGNSIEEKEIYSAFVSYDADIFLKVFYDNWFPDETSDAQFKLTFATAQLIEVMQNFAIYRKDYDSVKKNRLGMYCAIGDKMLFKATKYVEKVVLNALTEVETQKQIANTMYQSAKTKAEQDYALSYIYDKTKEQDTLNKCVNESLTTHIIFKRKDRKELVKSFFENLNNSNQKINDAVKNTIQDQREDAQPILIDQSNILEQIR